MFSLLFLKGLNKMKLKNIAKIYNQNLKNEVMALKNVNVSFETGKFYAIMGHSGSGKTSLINILGLLDVSTSGEYILHGKNVSYLSEKEKARIRNQEIGFVFQSYFLDNNLTAKENIELPLIASKISKDIRNSKSLKLLKTMGLENRMNHYPYELSGGECQRIAIARALINNPTYVICDEPTGNLDVENEKKIFELLKKISLQKKCVIVVTHNEIIKNYCDVLYVLEDGAFKSET